VAQRFTLVSPFALAGDQPAATDALARGIMRGDRTQTMLGVTGSGKTMAMARTIELVQKPTLVLCHNKTLAAQLCAEFRDFFPNNAVEYFVSYFDYYQPEAYVPSTDTYIEKDSSINDEIERLRHSATQSLLTRRDTLIVASVSCIFGLGSPSDYMEMSARVRVGETLDRDAFLRKLVDMQYRRNDINLVRGTFRVRGDTLEFVAVDEELVHRIEFFGDEITAITVVNQLTGEYVTSKDELRIFPAKHYITPDEKLRRAVVEIEEELEERLKLFRSEGKLLEAQRLELADHGLDQTGLGGIGVGNDDRQIDGRQGGVGLGGQFERARAVDHGVAIAEEIEAGEIQFHRMAPGLGFRAEVADLVEAMAAGGRQHGGHQRGLASAGWSHQRQRPHRSLSGHGRSSASSLPGEPIRKFAPKATGRLSAARRPVSEKPASDAERFRW